jgi:hypothetical protein
MEHPLHRFHTFKDMFLLGSPGKMFNAKANDLRMELVKMRKVKEETKVETWMPSKKRH